MRLWVIALSFLAACGDITVAGGARAEDASSPPDDGSGQADGGSSSSPDGSVDETPPRCRPDAPFGQKVHLRELGSAGWEDGGFLTQDELTIYFSRMPGGSGDHDLWFATRANRDVTFREPEPFAGVNTTEVERRPTLSSDGRVLVATTHDSSDNDDLSMARRQGTDPFPPLAPIVGLNGGGVDEAPYLLPNGRIYYGSDLTSEPPDAGEPPKGIWYSTLVEGGGVEIPTPIEGIDVGPGGPDESFPVLTPDELTLFFSSTRSGTFDIWIATRDSVEGGFEAAQIVAEVNTLRNEMPSWISPDGCVLYFVSEVSSGSDDYEIFVATRGD